MDNDDEYQGLRVLKGAGCCQLEYLERGDFRLGSFPAIILEETCHAHRAY